MKKKNIKDILRTNESDDEVEILGWIKSKRHLGNIIFLEIVDSSGSIEATIKKGATSPKTFSVAQKVSVESSVKLKGKLLPKSIKGEKEILVREIQILGLAELNLSPHPREDFDVFDPKYIDFILKKKHLFLRNPQFMSIVKLKYFLLTAIRTWFNKQEFIEVDTPILTQATLYRDEATFSVNYFGTQVYLSQCAGLYLEAAMHAFEKVYTVTPAFRAEPSHSPRHNPEFWHVKAQLAFSDFNEIVSFVEKMIYDVTTLFLKTGEEEINKLGVRLDISKLKPPYPQISYTTALEILRKEGLQLEWGKSLNEKAEKIVSTEFDTPFFITGMPRSVEPFPYSIDPLNSRVTKTADLLAPDGMGEILGVAEFISDPNELVLRMKEAEKYQQIERLRWYLELKQYGSVPHSGFGMGVERFLRWLLNLPHVRDAFLFPRLYQRLPYP